MRETAGQPDRAHRARPLRIQQRSAELARSNADLEQFAYVASHDLSEPLRKVTNFSQLLERQYADQLDDKARQYIAFMVDGAKRMQALINDLLDFSRVGRTTEHFIPVDLEQALARAMANLEEPIALAQRGGRARPAADRAGRRDAARPRCCRTWSATPSSTAARTGPARSGSAPSGGATTGCCPSTTTGSVSTSSTPSGSSRSSSACTCATSTAGPGSVSRCAAGSSTSTAARSGSPRSDGSGC